jgi:RecA-family ATPase
MRKDLPELGWRLGRSVSPRGIELWVRYDRTTGVYGAQGSGKTLDLLAPALLAHPGAALVTLTKVDDLLLTLNDREEEAGERTTPARDPLSSWTRLGWHLAPTSSYGIRSPAAWTR